MERTIKYVTELYNSFDYQNLIPLKEVEEIFHYTTSDTLIKIIEHRKLRFTNRLFLNDSSEGKYVLDLCIREIDNVWPKYCEYEKQEFVDSLKLLSTKIDSRYFQFYQASFSLCEDSLIMWNYYSQGNGTNINFSEKILLESLRNQLQDEVVKPIALLHGCVIYDEEEQIEILKKILLDFSMAEQYLDEWYLFTAMAVLNVGVFFKHYGFHDEREYRIVYNLYRDFDNPAKCLSLFWDKEQHEAYEFDVYKKANMLIPYVDVYFDGNAIQGILLSPKITAEYYADGLKVLLQKYGLATDRIKIKKSKIPLRF